MLELVHLALDRLPLARTYGATGNITGDDFGTGPAYGFSYNKNNRLAQALRGTSTIALYGQDYRGLRVTKAVPVEPNVIHFHYDRGGHVLAENVGTFGSFLREYVWLDDLPVGFVSNGALDYIHTDHLGTPQKMTDGGQNIVWDGAASDPFMLGQLPGSPPMNLRFPGQYFDTETGLHYNGMRDYDPTLGRYIESDPIGLAGGVNTYAYVDGNPITNIDFFGLDVTMTCRPLANPASRMIGWPKHCSDFVWHWETDPCTGIKHKVIDAQFSLPGGAQRPTTDSKNKTYMDDRSAFNNPGGNNHNYDIPPPFGESQSDFDEGVQNSGNSYSQGPYSLTGPNSNTAANNIILGAGGAPPQVSAAVGQNYGR